MTGFMKSPAKPQSDVQAKQALDKDPFSLISRTKQAESVSLDAKQGQRAGDVTGHGGSMSAQHGSPSLDSLDDVHLADRQSAADVIRNGSFLSSSQSIEAIGNNADASPQVDANMDAPEKRGEEILARNQATKRSSRSGSSSLSGEIR